MRGEWSNLGICPVSSWIFPLGVPHLDCLLGMDEFARHGGELNAQAHGCSGHHINDLDGEKQAAAWWSVSVAWGYLQEDWPHHPGCNSRKKEDWSIPTPDAGMVQIWVAIYLF